VPRLVTAVSKFSAVKSADRSTEAIGPNAVAGSASSTAVRPVKWTSPANATVMPAGGPLAAGFERAEWLALTAPETVPVVAVSAGPFAAGDRGKRARCRKMISIPRRSTRQA